MNRRFLTLSLLVAGALALGLAQTTPALAAQNAIGIGVVIGNQSGLAQGHFECMVAGIDTAPGQEGILGD